MRIQTVRPLGFGRPSPRSATIPPVGENRTEDVRGRNRGPDPRGSYRDCSELCDREADDPIHEQHDCCSRQRLSCSPEARSEDSNDTDKAERRRDVTEEDCSAVSHCSVSREQANDSLGPHLSHDSYNGEGQEQELYSEGGRCLRPVRLHGADILAGHRLNTTGDGDGGKVHEREHAHPDAIPGDDCRREQPHDEQEEVE